MSQALNCACRNVLSSSSMTFTQQTLSGNPLRLWGLRCQRHLRPRDIPRAHTRPEGNDAAGVARSPGHAQLPFCGKSISPASTITGRTQLPTSSSSDRRSSFFQLSDLRLSPKKKGGAAAAAQKTQTTGGGKAPQGGPAGADHIFNIFKDISVDHKLLDDKDYPAWLFTLDKPEKTYGELAMTFLYGVGIENATLDEYLRFTRLHTKNLIKLNNMRLKKSKRSSVKPLFWDV
ncbi:ribosomal protein L37 [Besnoitia besnoiti]|uniref:Ribosomal protein L37 n=1 Tax=Besnoitia besnoiti TaxID=94643 RepID=A0A2A9MBJ9_BESBE|nr:ribosomal protein L37 [Besnoitia besnoiti]PFH32770.1 ribosomal protein L37 [Besnoitia besnoiti]